MNCLRRSHYNSLSAVPLQVTRLSRLLPGLILLHARGSGPFDNNFKLVCIKQNDICHGFVPYHQEVIRAHQSHFCLRVITEDGGFQSDVSDIQTETEQHEKQQCLYQNITMCIIVIITIIVS